MKPTAILMASLLWSVHAEAQAAKRVAIVVGNNAAENQGRLRYAEQDARQVARVLETLGGVERTHLLLDRSASDLRDTVSLIGPQLDKDTTLFFFYSGHADARALLMRDSRYELIELQATLKGLGVKLFVAFIDACQAGSLSRFKGGQAVPIVDFDVYENERHTGGVFVTSGAPGENAQESDELEASLFTHYLLSGLRGAADVSQDRRVSLDEAYRFAYRHTLARTRGTLLGPQHPTRDVNVQGQGQLVLTWLSERSSYLVLPESARGTYFLRRADGQDLVAEVTKANESRMRIALEPGLYEVSKAEDGWLKSQVLGVNPRQEVVLDARKMSTRPLAQVQSKGGPVASRSHLALSYRLRSGYLRDANLSHGVNVAYLVDGSMASIGPTLSYSASTYRRSDDIDISLREIELGLRLEFVWRAFHRVGLFTGVELLAAWTAQQATFGNADDLVSTVTFPQRVLAGAEIELMSGFALVFLGHGGIVAYDTPNGPTVRFIAGFGTGLKMRL